MPDSKVGGHPGANKSVSLTKKQRIELRMMFGGRCAYCGVQLTGKWHADHAGLRWRKRQFIPVMTVRLA
jgi:hypothetical protein